MSVLSSLIIFNASTSSARSSTRFSHVNRQQSPSGEIYPTLASGWVRPLEPALAQGGSRDGKWEPVKLWPPAHRAAPATPPGGTDIESQERVNQIPEAAPSILKPKLPSRGNLFPQKTGCQKKQGTESSPGVPSRSLTLQLSLRQNSREKQGFLRLDHAWLTGGQDPSFPL